MKCLRMSSSLDEVVRRLAKKVRRHPRSLLTWFDDAGAIEFDGHYILIKVDGFAASRALYPWCTYEDFGFRGITAAVSDVVAKGCRPYIYAISIGVKPEHVQYVEEIMNGIDEAVKEYGGYVENVDTNVGYDTWIDVFVIGECKYLPIPRRAKALDRIILPRKVGLSTMGYIDYTMGRIPELDDVRSFTCRPKADIRIVDALERYRSCIDGSIDVSDTLLESMQQLSDVNDVGIYIYEDPSRILNPLADMYSRAMGMDPQYIALASNEEYIPLIIVKPSYEDEVLNALRVLGKEPISVGVITSDKDIRWSGRRVPKVIWNYVSGRIEPT